MDLLHKVRILVGALAHKPFMPRPEKLDPEEVAGQEPPKRSPRDVSKLEEQKPGVGDTDRVADLIVQRKKDGAC
jgi:hypothetical protein